VLLMAMVVLVLLLVVVLIESPHNCFDFSIVRKGSCFRASFLNASRLI
jgi:hypothetical protein